MTAFWAFVLEKILGPLGFGIVTDVTEGGLRRIVCRKRIKREEQRREETHAGVMALQKEMRDLKEMIASEPSEIIKKAANDLQPLIENLYVKTAHTTLSNLRKEIKSEDRRTLSRIDYYRGCCSRYVDKDACIADFNQAFQEMVDNTTFNGGIYDPDIVEGQIYVLCLNKEKDKAIQMASKLKEIDRRRIWAWVPDLCFSDNLKTAFGELPEDVDRMMALVNATHFGIHSESLCVDIYEYNPQIPDKLTFENIPLWLFNLSVLTNRYIPEWSIEAFMGDVETGPVCKAFYEMSSKFLSLIEKTELGELSPDVTLFHLITAYRITKNIELLPQLRDCKCSRQFEVFKQISYALFLFRTGDIGGVKDYLEGPEILSESSIYNLRFFIAAATADRDYAKESLQQLVEREVEMHGQMLFFLLVILQDDFESLIELARKIKVIGQINEKAFREILKSLAGDAIDSSFLLQNKDKMDLPMRPFVAIALNKAGLTQDALDLSESCVRNGFVDINTNIYITLLKQTHSYSRLNDFLRKLREGGFKENPTWLRDEYALAMKEEDFPRMLEIAQALYSLDAANPSYFVCLLSMHYQNGHFDKVKEMADQLDDYRIPENDVSQVFNVLLLSDLAEESVEFLYSSIKALPFSEELNLLFHDACMNPKSGPIIWREYDIVEEGLYVTYKHNGNLASDIMVDGQRISCMMGKQPGDVVHLTNKLGKEETYEVVAIHNKYYKLQEEVYSDIHDNKYQSTISFTMDDLQPDNLLGSLAKIAGRDEGWVAEHQKRLEDYRKGKQSISNFFNGDEIIAELYNHLFGDFKVFSVQIVDFNQLYEQRGVRVEDLEFVLDLPSVILLYELQLKFDLEYSFQMIVPRGIINLLEASIAKERHAMPAGIYQRVADLLASMEIKDGETWYLARLQGLLMWIKEKTKVEVAHEMVELDEESVFDGSRYMTLEFQSVFLARQDHRAFVSEDLALTLTLGNGMIVSDVNYLISAFCGDKYNEVAAFFMASNIYGCDLDIDYVISQYEKHSNGDSSVFVQCRENLEYCPSQYPVVLNVCSRLYSKPLLTMADRLVVDDLLTKMFKLFDRQTAMQLLQSSYRQLPHMRNALCDAFKTVYPVIV